MFVEYVAGSMVLAWKKKLGVVKGVYESVFWCMYNEKEGSGWEGGVCIEVYENEKF